MSEELQQKYMEMQMLSQQIKQMQQQFDQVGKQTSDMQALKESLETISETKVGGELLAAIGPGVFVKSSLAENKEVLMSVGTGAVVTKTMADATKIVDGQLKELEKLGNDLKMGLEDGMKHVQEIQMELQVLSQKTQG